VSELLDALDDALRYLHRRWTGSFPLRGWNAVVVVAADGNTDVMKHAGAASDLFL
jgi:hypothetical protein